MALVKYTCPTCKHVIQPYSIPTYSLGDPRRKCPKCNTYYLASNVFEWELLNPFSKLIRIIAFYVRLAIEPLLVSGFVSFIISIIAQSSIEYFKNSKQTTGTPLLLIQLVVYYPIIFYWMYWEDRNLLRNEISASKLRTADPKYKQEIKNISK